MLIVGYVFAIRSERALCREVQVNLAYRWFCGLGIDDKIPRSFSVLARTQRAVPRQRHLPARVRARRRSLHRVIVPARGSRRNPILIDFASFTCDGKTNCVRGGPKRITKKLRGAQRVSSCVFAQADTFRENNLYPAASSRFDAKSIDCRAIAFCAGVASIPDSNTAL